MLESIDTHEQEALAALNAATTSAQLETWRIAWLGTSGRVGAMMEALRSAPKDKKPALGKQLNAMKQKLDATFAQKKAAGAADTAPEIDMTEPGLPAGIGRRHVLTRTIADIVDIFGRMGFRVAEGPEVEDEWHNFTALNIPEGHPAREGTDNFYMAEQGGIRRLLRTQTSTVQIRTMEKEKPPLKIVAVGRVYRPDTHDATHFSMFHQVEGLCVDKNVSMVDLKTALWQFARACFGPEAEVRMRPSFFPFTEPSAEVDMKMKIKGEWRWVELGGCGMVDPAVFESVGIDPEVWSGYAFGLGVERIAMRRHGISDIRWLYENDARFLRQF